MGQNYIVMFSWCIHSLPALSLSLSLSLSILHVQFSSPSYYFRRELTVNHYVTRSFNIWPFCCHFSHLFPSIANVKTCLPLAWLNDVGYWLQYNELRLVSFILFPIPISSVLFLVLHSQILYSRKIFWIICTLSYLLRYLDKPVNSD